MHLILGCLQMNVIIGSIKRKITMTPNLYNLQSKKNNFYCFGTLQNRFWQGCKFVKEKQVYFSYMFVNSGNQKNRSIGFSILRLYSCFQKSIKIQILLVLQILFPFRGLCMCIAVQNNISLSEKIQVMLVNHQAQMKHNFQKYDPSKTVQLCNLFGK